MSQGPVAPRQPTGRASSSTDTLAARRTPAPPAALSSHSPRQVTPALRLRRHIPQGRHPARNAPFALTRITTTAVPRGTFWKYISALPRSPTSRYACHAHTHQPPSIVSTLSTPLPRSLRSPET